MSLGSPTGTCGCFYSEGILIDQNKVTIKHQHISFRHSVETQSLVYRSEKKTSAVHPTQAASQGSRQDLRSPSPHHQQGLGSRSRLRPHGCPWGVNTSACGSKTKPSPLPPRAARPTLTQQPQPFLPPHGRHRTGQVGPLWRWARARAQACPWCLCHAKACPERAWLAAQRPHSPQIKILFPQQLSRLTQPLERSWGVWSYCLYLLPLHPLENWKQLGQLPHQPPPAKAFLRPSALLSGHRGARRNSSPRKEQLHTTSMCRGCFWTSHQLHPSCSFLLQCFLPWSPACCRRTCLIIGDREENGHQGDQAAGGAAQQRAWRDKERAEQAACQCKEFQSNDILRKKCYKQEHSNSNTFAK